jgi:hypothetical protein
VRRSLRCQRCRNQFTFGLGETALTIRWVAAKLGSHWPARPDPFSTYRANFEVRTYRLCRRVLMFHHFAGELGSADYLVRSTEFAYSPSPIASFIMEITQSGYSTL